MENERVKEIDFQLKQLKSNSPEVYGWILMKEKQELLKKELEGDDPNQNFDEKRKEIEAIAKEMDSMKKKYSSIMLYEALTSVRQKMLEKSEDIL